MLLLVFSDTAMKEIIKRKSCKIELYEEGNFGAFFIYLNESDEDESKIVGIVDSPYLFNWIQHIRFTPNLDLTNPNTYYFGVDGHFYVEVYRQGQIPSKSEGIKIFKDLYEYYYYEYYHQVSILGKEAKVCSECERVFFLDIAFSNIQLCSNCRKKHIPKMELNLDNKNYSNSSGQICRSCGKPTIPGSDFCYGCSG